MRVSPEDGYPSEGVARGQVLPTRRELLVVHYIIVPLHGAVANPTPDHVELIHTALNEVADDLLLSLYCKMRTRGTFVHFVL